MRFITESDAPVSRDDIAAYEHADELLDGLYDRAAIHEGQRLNARHIQHRINGRALNTWEFDRAH